MSDGVVQVQPDSTGKKVDTSELTRGDSSATVVERQRVVLGDDCDVSAVGVARVRDGRLQVGDPNTEVLRSIDAKLEQIVFILGALKGP